MRIVAVNGSPKKHGNTAFLLSEVLRPLEESGWETRTIHIGAKHLQGCRACMKCLKRQDKRCIFDNDVFNGYFEQLLEADAIVLGTPCYFTDMTAEMKAFIDRAGFVALTNGDLLKGKIGAAVIAARRAGATHAFDSINHMFLMSKMIVPGSIYWNIGYGLKENDVLQDKEALVNMRDLGKTIAWLGNAIGPHMASFPARQKI